MNNRSLRKGTIMNNLVAVTVSIPQNRVSDLYAFAATLHTTPSGKGTSTAPKGEGSGPGEVDADAIRDAYRGGSNNAPWRLILDALADHAGEEVYWPDLCERVGLNRRSASGVIGAGERRCKNHVPYTKRYLGDETWFLMSPEVAEVIKKLAAEKK